MPDLRLMPKVRDRLDLLWFKRRSGARGWLRRLCWLGLVAAVALGAYWTLRGDQRVYWARPVSSAHRMFAHDCAACHQQQGTPLMRLVTGDNRLASVTDADCRRCHEQAMDDHHANASANVVHNCVDCHREHAGHPQLANVADGHCTQCHGDLQTKAGQPHFVAKVDSFAMHPEFKLWRSEDAAQAAKSPKVDNPHEHQLLQLAEALAASDSKPARWRDPTPLNFNHHMHLVEQGVLVPPDAQGSSKSLRKVLTCYDCHRPDANGAAMQPINYERHCASCHKLEFSGKFALPGRPLPHENAEAVTGVLRERLMQYAEQHPREVLDLHRESPSRLPQRQEEVAPTAKEKWDYVEGEMIAAKQDVFQNQRQGCRLCHQLQTSPIGSIEIIAPRIPSRWLPHSTFDHSRHREVSCERCHDPEFDLRTQRGHADAQGRFSALASSQTSDLLLPKIETCRQCHGNQASAGLHAGAKADCITCHTYHHDKQENAGRMDVWLQEKQGYKPKPSGE